MPFANVNSLIWQVITFLSQKWLHFIIFLFSFNIREFCHRFWTTSNPLLQTNFSHQWSGGKDPSKKFGKKETLLCGTSKNPKISTAEFLPWEKQIRSLKTILSDRLASPFLILHFSATHLRGTDAPAASDPVPVFDMTSKTVQSNDY